MVRINSNWEPGGRGGANVRIRFLFRLLSEPYDNASAARKRSAIWFG